jgi:type IV pilus assembly protein PilB
MKPTPTPTLNAKESWSSLPSARTRMRLGERLVRGGIITQTELETALAQQGQGVRIGEQLVKLGFVQEEDLLPYLAEQMGIPSARVREGMIDPEVVKSIPREVAEEICGLVLFRVRNELTVALADPHNLVTLDLLEQITGLRIRPVLALRSSLEQLIPRVYGEGFEVDSVTADMDVNTLSIDDELHHVDVSHLSAAADGSPIINLVNYMILQAVRTRASDIHIEPGARHTSVRFRVDGMLREVLKPRKEFHGAIVSRIKVMAKMDIAEHRLPQDGRIHAVVDRHEVDLRTSTLPTVLGEKVVLRVLDRGNVTFRLDELGFPDQELTQLRELLHRPYGMVLVTGPTGSGKTTTLYSAVELIKSVERNIVTVEDPVEYRLDLINQVHANAATNLTFAKALRSILRQDPDVIMIGEIRDGETAEVAIQAALTGHLVLSTLHTNDCASAITRLVDMHVAPFKISAALLCVVAQRLARKVCSFCRGLYYPDKRLLDTLRYAGNRNRQFVRGSGCEKCFDSGFQGRVGIYEFMVANRELRDLIIQTAAVDRIRDWHRSQGGKNLLEQGLRIAEAGTTSLEEVMRVAMFD